MMMIERIKGVVVVWNQTHMVSESDISSSDAALANSFSSSSLLRLCTSLPSPCCTSTHESARNNAHHCMNNNEQCKLQYSAN